MSAADGSEPVFRIVRGTPTPEELAALVGVLLTRPRRTARGADTGLSPWVRLARPGALAAPGLPARPGGSAWRLSGLPR